MIGIQCSAQSELSDSRLYRIGMADFQKGNYKSSRPYLEEYYKRTKSRKLEKTLAHMYRGAREYAMAEDFYRRCYEESHQNDKESQFYLACMLKQQGKYREAKKEFLDFLQTGIRFHDVDKLKKLAQAELEGCSFTGTIPPVDSVRVFKVDTSINKGYSEGSPMYLNDSLFAYAAFGSDSIFYDPAEEIIPESKSKRLYLGRSRDTIYRSMGAWSEPFSFPGFHTGGGSLSKDGKRFFFTRCAKNWKYKVICAICLSEKKDTGWTLPLVLRKLSSMEYSYTQPSLERDARGNDLIYFSSDRKGGKGGFDIWYVSYNPIRKKLGRISNAGSLINTKGDEITPFATEEKLFFSSDGWPGYGGLDIFSNDRKPYSNPKNLGTPFNTGADEMYYTQKPGKREGLLVSNRGDNGNCCDDIFAFDYKGTKVELKGRVAANQADKPLEKLVSKNDPGLNLAGVDVSLFKTDSTTLLAHTVTDEEGAYTLNALKQDKYILKLKKEGYLNLVTTITSLNGEIATYTLNMINDKPVVIRNIQYPFGSDELTDTARSIIDRTLYVLLVSNPSLSIEIASHTDSVGTEAFNIDLSIRRAKKVSDYLIEKGINASRLTTNGFGEARPIAPNTLPDGSDFPEGRAANRRTEFRITALTEN